MKKIFSKRASKLICACLALICCLSALVGCQSAELVPMGQARKVVGTVGDNNIYYDEFYYLASMYKTDGITSEKLWEDVSDNIVLNTAMLTLADEVGVEYGYWDLKSDIQSYIDDQFVYEAGSVENYRAQLKEKNMTDRYLRNSIKAELMYGKVPQTLIDNGAITSDEAQFVKFVRENLVRTWHYMIALDANDNIADVAEDIQAVRNMLKNNETTIYDLTFNKGYKKLPHKSQNEDLTITEDGYTFAKGEMHPTYENTAFGLEVGEFSDVIMFETTALSGNTVKCFFVVQRLELTDEYIVEHFEDLYDSYVSAVAANMLDEVKGRLTFEPNDYAKSLDILNLEPVDIGTDLTPVVICAVILGVVAITGVIIGIVIYRQTIKAGRYPAKPANRPSMNKKKK